MNWKSSFISHYKYITTLAIVQEAPVKNCSSVPWLKDGTTNSCNALLYNGSLCKEQLITWQQCALEYNGDNSIMYTEMSSRSSSVQAKEEKINLLLSKYIYTCGGTHKLWSLCTDASNSDSSKAPLSAECFTALKSFLCQYNFPLCDKRGQLYLPPFEDCFFVLTVQCNLSTFTNYTSLLYECFDLPKSELYIC